MRLHDVRANGVDVPGQRNTYATFLVMATDAVLVAILVALITARQQCNICTHSTKTRGSNCYALPAAST